MTDDRWLTVAEIVERLRVHEETVRRWLREGRLPGRAFGGRTGYRVRESDLEAFLNGELETPKIAA
jgi:excisionase family DNA binding protein